MLHQDIPRRGKKGFFYTYKSRLLKQNKTPRSTINRNARHTGTTMASISPLPEKKKHKAFTALFGIKENQQQHTVPYRQEQSETKHIAQPQD